MMKVQKGVARVGEMVCALAQTQGGRSEVSSRKAGRRLLWRPCEMNMDTAAASGRDKGHEWGRVE